MSKKKVLLVIPYLGLGGAETMCENLAYELYAKNVDVEIVSFYTRETDITNRIKEKNIKINYLDKKKGPDMFMLIRLSKLIKKLKPDVIHTHLYVLEYVLPAVKMSGLKNTKIVHTVHNVAEKEVPKRIQKIHRKNFKNGNVVPVAITELIQSSVCNLYKLDKKNVPVVYNGIDLDKCIEKKNYSGSNKILHVGRFFEQKNHIFLIQIFDKLKSKYSDLELYLVGEGKLKNNVIEYVKEHNIKNVKFLGSLPDSYSIMNKCDIFLLPSKWEGMPMTIIEAMGTGLPVVASNVGGIPNMIDNEINGFIANDLDDFVLVISKLIENLHLREKIGKNAIIKAKEFSSSNMTEKYIEIYNK